MLLSRILICTFSAGLLAAGALPAFAQNYPGKPIRIVTSPAGSGNDFLARLVAQGLSGPLGQQVNVDNRAGGVIPGDVVAKSPPDGYTLFIAGTTFLIGPLLQKAPYDSVRDFSPITLVCKEPSVLIVHPSLPAKSVKELIALAKARPGELNYGFTSIGSSTQLAPELFKSMTGTNMVGVPYKGSGLGLAAIIGGEVHLMFSPAAPMAPYIKSGRLKALAVTSAEPSALVPGVPTVAASVPGYEDVGITALLAPANTPAAIVNRLNQEMIKFLGTADVKEKFFNLGAEAASSSPEQLAAFMKSEVTKKGKMIRDAGIRVE